MVEVGTNHVVDYGEHQYVCNNNSQIARCNYTMTGNTAELIENVRFRRELRINSKRIMAIIITAQQRYKIEDKGA